MIKEVENPIHGKDKLGIEGKKISLWLDDYNDIFSDFDSRNYSQRSLSVDFLDEIKRATRDKPDEGLELNLSIPHILRNTKEENVIKIRLKDHFKKYFEKIKQEIRRTILKGVGFVLAGMIFMFLGAWISFKYQQETFFTSFLIVLLEPAGWFSFWEGLNIVIFDSKERDSDLEFNRKMSKASINFNSY